LERRALLALTITVNTATDENSNDSTLSLREAIEVANGTLAVSSLSAQEQLQVTTNQASQNLIAFKISGSGVHTITLATPLPAITSSVTIDGDTQPGASANTLANGDNAVLEIQLDGSQLGLGFNALGFNMVGGTSTIRGIDFTNFGGVGGIEVTCANNLIEGNFIGMDPAGTTAAPCGNGIDIRSINFVNADGNTIGGTTPDARNVISSKPLGDGIQMGTSNDVVEGNFIGTDASGTKAIPNLYGLSIGVNDTVGGTTAGARNVISGNVQYGVYGDVGDVVEGNYIGTDVTGTKPLGNGRLGVEFSAGADTIGGTTAGSGNVIAFNGATQGDGCGIGIFRNSNTVGVAILGNSIFSNASNGQLPGRGLGIDNGVDGVTPNTPNNALNFPVITGATAGASSTTIQGTLNSAPNTTYRIEFFSSAAANPTGYGEGQTYLGYMNVTTDSSGNSSFTATVAAPPAGQSIFSATSTDVDTTSGFINTSEFSKAVTGGVIASADLSVSVAAPQTATEAQNLSYTITVKNSGPAGATGVTVVDTLPAGVNFVSATGGVTPSNGAVTFSVGALAAGATTTLTLVVQPTTTGTIQDTATVSGDQPDPNSSNNTSSATTTVSAPSADLSIAVGASQTATVGQSLTYTLTVHNAGPNGVGQATVVDTLPSGVTFVSATGSITPSNGMLTFAAGALASGASTTLTIVVTPTAAGQITDSATVTGDISDPNPNNNSSSATTTVSAGPSQTTTTLVSSANPSTLGQPVTFTATVTANTSGGANPAGPVSFSDGTTPLGSMNVDPTTGMASVTVSNFTLGSHTITASYGGDSNTLGSPSNVVTQIVRSVAVDVWLGAGPDDHWTDGANWLGGVAPAPGDRLEFPAGAAQLTNHDDFPDGTLFSSIMFSGNIPAPGYTLMGNLIAVGSGGIIDSSTMSMNLGKDVIDNDLTFPGNTVQVNVSNPVHWLELNGARSGTAGLVKAGGGVLELQGADSGPGPQQVAAGLLLVHSAAALGSASAPITVSAGAGLGLQQTGSIAKPLTLGGLLYNVAGQNAWTGNIVVSTLAARSGFFYLNPNSQLTVSGAMSGAAPYEYGFGVLRLTGNNSFASIGVYGGTLDVSQDAALGPAGSVATVGQSAILRLSGDGVNITRQVVLSSGAILESAGGHNMLSGPLTLQQVGNGQVFAAVDVATGVLTIPGAITDTERIGLVKTGAGRLELAGNNPNDLGPHEVSDGTLAVEAAGALGPAGSAPVQVDAGGTLEMPAAISLGDALFLAGSGAEHAGALHILSNPSNTPFNFLSMPVHLMSDATINIDANAVVIVYGSIDYATQDIHQQPVQLTHSVDLVKTGAGVLALEAANSADLTTVLGGAVVATNSQALGKLLAATVVQPGGTLELSNSVQVPGVNLFLSDSSHLQSFGKEELLPSPFSGLALTVDGRATVQVSHSPTLAGPGELDLIGLEFNGSTSSTLVKTDAGLLALQGASLDPSNHLPQSVNYQGTIDIQGGTVQLNRYGLAQALMLVEQGAMLSATNDRSDVGGIDAQAGSTVADVNAGWLNSTGDVTLPQGSTFSVALSQAVTGPYLIAQGAVSLGGSLVLTGVSGQMPAGSITLIHKTNPGAVVGTFNGLAEGSLLPVGGLFYRITYHGGSGNDVVLNPTNPRPKGAPPAPGGALQIASEPSAQSVSGGQGQPGQIVTLASAPAIDVWTGAGADPFWSDGKNWQSGRAPAPGDALVFPAGAAQLTINNDFPDGTSFDSLTFSGSLAGAGYILQGNRITLGAGGITDTSQITGGASTQDVNSIQNDLAFTGNTVEVTVSVPNHTLALSDNRSGTAGLVKEGEGNLKLDNSDSGPGLRLVSAGWVDVDSASALGTATSAITVSPYAHLDLFSVGTVSRPLVLAGDLVNDAGNNTWTGPVTTADPTVTVNAGQLTLAGTIYGTGLAKFGTGLLVLGGTVTLSDFGADQGTVVVTSSSPSLANSSILIQVGATLELLGDGITLGALTMGGTLESVGGRNTVAGSVGLFTGAASAAPGTLPAFEVDTGVLAITGQITSDGVPINPTVATGFGFAKTGLGRLEVSGNNTYPGVTDVREGTLAVLTSSSLGPYGTQVEQGATLELPPTIHLSEDLFLAGNGVDGAGALHVTASPTNGRAVLNDSRAIHLIGPAMIGVDSSAVLQVFGAIDIATKDIFGNQLTPAGPTSLVKVGSGGLVGLSTLPAGPITVAAGFLLSTANDGDATDNIVVQSGSLYAPEFGAVSARHFVLAGSSTVYAYSKAVFTGSVLAQGNLAVDVYPDPSGKGELEFAHAMLTGMGTPTITKYGSGTLSFRGTDPAYATDPSVTPTHPFGSPFAGTIDVNQGSVLLSEFALDHTSFIVEKAATLSAAGGQDDVGGLDAKSGSTVVTGGAGRLVSTGDVKLESGSQFTLAVIPPVPGPYLTAQGAVTLGGTLTAIGIPGQVPGGPITLIHKTSGGPVSGTFAGLAEAALVDVAGVIFRITYRGGSGNDVVLLPVLTKASLAAPAQAAAMAFAPVLPTSTASIAETNAPSTSKQTRIAARPTVHPRGPVRMAAWKRDFLSADGLM
jgi:uncharacterized repeat protein (TIGR01451 family)